MRARRGEEAWLGALVMEAVFVLLVGTSVTWSQSSGGGPGNRPSFPPGVDIDEDGFVPGYLDTEE